LGQQENELYKQGDEFGECAGAVDADALRVGAEMPAAGHAIAAASAGDMALAAHDVAGIEVVYVGANLDDLSDKLMPMAIGTGIVFCAHSSH